MRVGTVSARRHNREGTFPPPTEPLPVPVLDSHTHIDITLEDDGVGGPSTVADAIALAAGAGVDRLVQGGGDGPSSRWGVQGAEEPPGVVATVALPPNDAPRLSDLDEALREIERLAAHPRGRGVGETGVDDFRPRRARGQAHAG